MDTAVPVVYGSYILEYSCEYIMGRSVSDLYYNVKQLVSMDTAVPVVYGSYILEYSCEYIMGRQWFS